MDLREIAAQVRQSCNRDVPRLAKLKELAIAKLGREAAWDFLREEDIFGNFDRLELKPVATFLEAASLSGATLKVADPGGQTFNLDPPVVLGEGNHRRLTNRSRANYLVCFADAFVRGRSGFLDLGPLVCADFERWEQQLADDQRSYDPIIFQDCGDTAWVVARERDRPDAEVAEAFSLLGPHSVAFGHLIMEFLPKYVQGLGNGLRANIPILVDEQLHANHLACLRLLNPDAEIIEVPARSVLKVGRLWCAPTLTPMPVFAKLNERFHIDLMTAPLERLVEVGKWCRRQVAHVAPLEGNDRVYLARKPHSRRKLVNHANIERIAVQNGFAIVFPEDLSFEEQIGRMKASRFIVGPEGSGLMNLVWAAEEAKVLILNHTITIGLPLLTAPLEALGFDIRVLTGPVVTPHAMYPHFSDYQIDESAFEGALRDMFAPQR